MLDNMPETDSSMCAGGSQKEDESIYWLGAGSFQTGGHGVSGGDWSSDIPI